MAPSSRMSRGSGEGTTRRQAGPSGATAQPRSRASRRASSYGVDRPDRLRRPREGGIGGVDDDLRQERRDLPTGELVPQALLEEVADHALALGAENVERVGADAGVGLALEGEEPDLRAVPVRDDDVVSPGELGHGPHGDADVPLLDRGLGGLTAPEQRVPTEGADDPHVSGRWWSARRERAP